LAPGHRALERREIAGSSKCSERPSSAARLHELARAPVAVVRRDDVPFCGTSASSIVVTEFMPDAETTQSSPPSSAHSFISTARVVGLP